MKNGKKLMAVIGLMGGLQGGFAEELLSGPYTFGATGSVHVKPAMLADGWGMTVGGAWESIINKTVTAGFEVDADIPVVSYPTPKGEPIQMVAGGLRLGALLASDQVVHGMFNNTIGVGLVADQTFLLDEVSAGGEINVTKAIRIFGAAGWRYTYGINNDHGLSDTNARGLFFDVGLRYGEL